jgi:hypothetical protein
VLFVGGVDARLLREIEPADDADALGHVAGARAPSRHCRRQPRACNERPRPTARPAPCRCCARRGHQPDVGQRFEQAWSMRRVGFAQPVHRRGLQHHAQVVELLELVEVERQHAPAAAKQHFDKALLLQPEQRLAHRRARHAEPLADFVLGETVAGHEDEVGHVALELRVDLVGACGNGGVGSSGVWERQGSGAGSDGRHVGNGSRWRQRHAVLFSAASSAVLVAVQPTMAPWARIISSAAALKCGK